MSLILKIWPKNISDQPLKSGSTTEHEELVLTFYQKGAAEPTYINSSDSFKLTPIELSFCKQMYQPGEIHARIQIKGVKPSDTADEPVLSLSAIQTNFLNQKVELTDGTNSVASNYYIYELTRDKRTEKVFKDNTSKDETHWYVDFKIYSLDKLLTLDKDNKTYVAKRLGTDILKTKAGEKTLPYNSSTYLNSIDSNNAYNYLLISFQNKLKNGSSEFIQPYLVQYDESFYDMLIRTANRWGEFVYFEEGKLTLGRKDFSLISGYNTPTLSKYLSVSHIKSDAKTVSDNCAKAVVTDDYLEVIKESYKPQYDTIRQYDKKKAHYNSDQSGNEYILQSGDMYTMDRIYCHKVTQSFLNMKGNVIDWAFNNFYDDGIAAAQNEHLLYHRENEYNEHFFQAPKKKGTKDDYNSDGEKIDDLELRYGTVQGKNNQNIDAYWPYADKGSSADSDTGLNVKNYKDVLAKELEAGKDMLCVEMGDPTDTNYQYLRLGEVFTYDSVNYIVTKVEGIVDDQLDRELNWTEKEITSNISINGDNLIDSGLHLGEKEGTLTIKIDMVNDVTLKHVKSLRYRIYAIQTVSDSSTSTKIYYPPMLPTGHIRFSGPQRGFIHDTLDPMMNGRYRVRMWWQTYDKATNQLDGPASPWLRVSREMTKKSSGGVWQLVKDTEVLLDFQDGNVELPYIIGTLQENTKRANARSTMFNNLDLTTPAGHAIRMTDGDGGGIANLFASFQPIWKMVQGFNPHEDPHHYEWHYGEQSKFFEGGIELTDKYGFYSIKASTDQRNISIKSPWGDVLLSAFTGITISAPNGDVKIQGKNVSIEARNNLSITSGTNIADGLFGNSALGFNNELKGNVDTLKSVGSSVAKTVVGKFVSYLDIPVMRHFLELVLRPVCGAMDIKSFRSISINAGFDRDKNYFWESSGTANSNVDAWLKSNNNLANAFLNSVYRFKRDDDWLGKESHFNTVNIKSTTVHVNNHDLTTTLNAGNIATDAQDAANRAQHAVADARAALVNALTALADANTAEDNARAAEATAQTRLNALTRGEEGNELDNLVETRIRNLVAPNYRNVILVAHDE